MAVPAPETIVFDVRGPIARSDLPGLCDRVCELFGRSNPDVAFCDVGTVEPDAVTVDALARLQLAARRYRCQVRLRNASAELLDLVSFMGLTDVLPDQAKEEKMAGEASRKIFVNLPVADLERSVAFFNELGFAFDPRFTDETATCMVVSDEAFVMLLQEDRFSDFTKKHLADSKVQIEAIVAVSANSREEVDDLADRAIAAGGAPAGDPVDMDFMYSRSFDDLDGHQWEVVWMDPSAIEAGPPAEARATS